jgi:hypothetical protein
MTVNDQARWGGWDRFKTQNRTVQLLNSYDEFAETNVEAKLKPSYSFFNCPLLSVSSRSYARSLEHSKVRILDSQSSLSKAIFSINPPRFTFL